MQARARFSGFGPLQKKLHFGIVLNLHFGTFVSSMRRKQGFYGCLNIARILNRSLKHFGLPQIGQKSIKTRSSGSSWAKMAPRRCHLEPTWLQEPIFIDLRSIFTWFWNVIFSSMLIDIVPRLRANFDSHSREVVKTRSCGVAKARRREAVLDIAFVVTFEKAVQRIYALWHFTLLHIALLCLAPCMDMHGFTLVHIWTQENTHKSFKFFNVMFLS